MLKTFFDFYFGIGAGIFLSATSGHGIRVENAERICKELGLKYDASRDYIAPIQGYKKEIQILDDKI